MKNPYKDIYPKSTDWTYTYECPGCSELVPLSIDPNSAPFDQKLIGQCQNCKLNIRISEEDFKEWELNQQKDFINENEEE